MITILKNQTTIKNENMDFTFDIADFVVQGFIKLIADIKDGVEDVTDYELDMFSNYGIENGVIKEMVKLMDSEKWIFEYLAEVTFKDRNDNGICIW